ncbi:MAG: hypothetical protein CMP65_01405 [Flavobacteriales bacterium]|nr:hypothetical protein [Flavobacteriales bacterium]
MVKKSLILILFTTLTFAQKDTIFATDTLISHVRVINYDLNKVGYFEFDSIKGKIYNSISTNKVEKVIYENAKIEVFCDLISTKKFLSTTENITINYGNRDSLWNDDQIYNLITSDLTKYNSLIDALNYMGNEGWKVIGSYSSSSNSYLVEHYILKKELIKTNKYKL